VYKSTTSGFTPASSDSVGVTASGSIITYTVTGLTNLTPYYFRVKAVNTSDQAGEYSSQKTATPVYQGPDWYVAVAASGGSNSNEGSINLPMLKLSDAVTAASTGHTIHIGSGTHQYTSASNWNIPFDGSKTLVIKGAGRDATILDAQQKHRHFYFNASNSSSTLLDTTFKIKDLTLKNGRPQSTDHGGSVYMNGYWDSNLNRNRGHSPLFQNVVFQSNQPKFSTNDYSKYGGAVYAYRGTPYFRSVIFKYNTSPRQGGAIYIHQADTNKTITFERTTFTS
ncbi:uncharacterized protein METZ01_LOCUS407083, partial [marine metagenome]